MKPRSHIVALLTVALLATVASPALAVDDAHVAKARKVVDKAITYLRSTQGEDGSWTPKVGPAITALAAAGMLDQPNIDRNDPHVAKAIAYILSKRKDNGGIYDNILPNYNTSIALVALGRLAGDKQIDKVIKDAQDFVIGIQFQEGKKDQAGNPVKEGHPHYGGSGYQEHGRPDMSNTSMMVDGLFDSGLDCNDPAFKRAIEFISQCQGTPENKKYGDKIVNDGGFIYSLSGNDAKDIGNPTSKAGEVEVGGVSRLRTYGTMTYAGFKSYMYAQLDRNDPRVKAVRTWIANNYKLDCNPGLPDPMRLQGHYYYMYLFARANQAWGEPIVTDAKGVKHDWANELIDELAKLQNEDGSFINDADRWMEGDKNLVTGYALMALNYAIKGR